MIDNKQVKEILFKLGADLCGIASIDRFNDAPKGYHPTDVLPTCKSVISFGCRFPIGTLSCDSPVPYTRVRNTITPKMDAMALEFCIEMEKYQIVCIPIPTNESQWDENTKALYYFSKTRSTGSGIRYDRETFFAYYTRIWKYGLVGSSFVRTRIRM